jgi:hypothetical protein
LIPSQRDAWSAEIEILRSQLTRFIHHSEKRRASSSV